MGIKEDMIAITSDILQHTPVGLTGEALVRQVMPRLPRRVSPAQIIDVVRKMPQRLVEGEDGRWRLREQGILLASEDGIASSDSAVTSQQSLRQGCYVVFDLETTGSDAQSAET